MDKLIYLDNAATSIVSSEVLSTFNKVITDYIGNPSSIHFEGSKSSRLLDKARNLILTKLGLSSTHEVIFTSGATEANNLAIQGYLSKYKNRGKHIITSASEHASVIEVFKKLENEGFDVTYINSLNGVITLEMIKPLIREDTIFISLMSVNNEVGFINEISKIAEYLKDFPKIAFHSDATQAIGKELLDFKNVDFISFSSHKIHGLKSSGALLKKKNISLSPINLGGGQEYGFRSGTNDVAISVATAKAIDLAMSKIKENHEYVSKLYNLVYNYINNNKDIYSLNSGDNNTPYIINFSTLTSKASVVVEALSNNNIMVSSISACHSKDEAKSNVVLSMGKSEKEAANTIRVSFSELNTIEEVNAFISLIDKIVKEVKSR